MSSMQGKAFDDISPFLNDIEKNQLAGDAKYFVWGCQPSLQSRWDKMEHGDYVLFYAQGRFISVGTLKFKKKSESLALSLWPKSQESGEPWSCVFFVKNMQDINLPLGEFNDITGYKLQALQGFMQITSSEALNRIEGQYGSTDALIRSLTIGIPNRDLSEIATLVSKPSADFTKEDTAKLDELTRSRTPEEIEAVLKAYSEKQLGKKPEQVARLTKSYRRNVGLVAALKEKYDNKCQICGFTFKTSAGTFYSEAAHIIPISKALAGVDSPDNIWILCANHHKMLDRGAIVSIDSSSYTENGVVKKLLAV
jgi:5-methylcytosine-specific restriction endonuclease McrA